MRLLETILLTTLSPAFVAAVQAEDDKPDTKAIQGTWQAVELQVDGKQEGDDICKLIEMKFDGDKMFFKRDKGPAPQGSFKLDASQNPKRLDLAVKDEKALAIYEFSGG